jgi:hypothetical protein
LIPFLIGCNAQKKSNRLIEKAERHARKHNLLIVDTVTVEHTIRDTIEVITERLSVDTVFNMREVHDTLILERDKLRIKYYYDTITKQVYLDAVVEHDTIFQPYEKTIYIDVPCEKIQHVTKKNNTFWLWVIIILETLAIGWLLKLIIRYKSRPMDDT